MAEYDPSNDDVDTVLKKLGKAKAQEQKQILAAERAGKARKGILEPYGIDPDERVDATGRVLYPWEANPVDQQVEVEESPEARKAREAQAEVDQQVAAAAAANAGDEQGGVTAAGVGTAAAGVATAPATGSTTGTTGGTVGGVR
jgi:hypothetical protein